MKYIVTVKKNHENGLSVSTDLPDSNEDIQDVEIVTIETTGATRSIVGMGPKRGWNEVVVTDKDGRGRIGWVPWNSTGSKEELPPIDSDFLVIWDLGTYGPDTND